MEEEVVGPGPVVGVDGYPSLVSSPSDSMGVVKYELPVEINAGMMPYYLTFSGTFKGVAFEPSMLAPKRWFDPKSSSSSTYLHFMSVAGDASVASEIAKSLAAQGNITAAEQSAFKTMFKYDFGNLSQQTDGVVVSVNYGLTVDGKAPTKPTSCKPSTECCVFFAQNYKAFKVVGGKFIDTQYDKATRPSNGPVYNYFALVCPASAPEEVTLHEDGAQDPFGFAASYNDIKAPLRAGVNTYVEWIGQ